MYCNRCGSIVPRGSKFCRHCGTRLDVPGAATLLPDEVYSPDAVTQRPGLDKARELFKKALDASEQDDVHAAISLCKQAIAHDPDYTPAHSLLANLYERIGDKKAAYAEYEIVLRLNPQSAIDRAAWKRLRRELGLPDVEPPVAAPSAPAHVRSLPLVAAATFAVALIFIVRLVYNPPQSIQASNVNVTPIPADVTPLPASPNATWADQPDTRAQQLAARAAEAYQRGDYATALKLFQEAAQYTAENAELQAWIQRAQQKLNEQRRMASAQTGKRAAKVTASTAQQHRIARAPSDTRQSVVGIPPLPAPTAPMRQSGYSAEQSAKQPSGVAPPSGAGVTPNYQWQQQQMVQRRVTTPTPAPRWTYPWQLRRLPMPPVTSTGTAQPSPKKGRVIVRVAKGGSGTQTSQTASEAPSATTDSSKGGKSHASAIPVKPLNAQVSVDELESAAADHAQRGDWDGAIKLYNQLLQRGVGIEREGIVRQSLAMAYQRKGWYSRAAREYERAIQAYERQKQRGINVKQAERGIRACQQALELCQSK